MAPTRAIFEDCAGGLAVMTGGEPGVGLIRCDEAEYGEIGWWKWAAIAAQQGIESTFAGNFRRHWHRLD
jgi:hypothetical protein